MMTRRLGVFGAAVCVMLILAAAASLLGLRTVLPATGQENRPDVPRVELLMQDIHFLELLRNLGFTARQRLEAAKAIETFHEKRKAIEKLSETDELLKALTAVREALLQGKAPTDEMREAVEVARPPDDGSVDQAFRDARLEVMEKLIGLLTDEQKQQLEMMPLFEFANHVIGMSMEAQEIGDEEFGDWRKMVTVELFERLGVTGDEEADAVNEVVQGAITRFSRMTPEQIMAQREQLVPEFVSALNGALPENRQTAWDRAADALWEWVANPRVGPLMRESAAAMGAE